MYERTAVSHDDRMNRWVLTQGAINKHLSHDEFVKRTREIDALDHDGLVKEVKELLAKEKAAAV